MISEPSTLITDYLLGSLAAALASRLFAASRNGSHRAAQMWGGALGAVAVASFAGGTYHGFGRVMAAPATSIVWKLTTMSMGVASFLLLAAAIQASFYGRLRGWLLAVAAAKLLIYLLWMMSHDGFVWVILDYGSTLLIVLALAVSGRTHGAGAHRTYVAAGILVSIAAAAVQQSGFRLHQHFNHNDLMHVIQMGGVWLLFEGGARLRDAEAHHGSQS
jgi:hypothetical protein